MEQNPEKKGGRKYTPEEAAAIKEVFLQAHENNGGTISASCRKAGIARQTFYDWTDPLKPLYDAEFAERCKEIKEECVDNVEVSVYTNALEGSYSHAALYLKTMRPEKWRETSHINLNGTLNAPAFTLTKEDALEVLRKAGMEPPAEPPVDDQGA